MLFMPGSKGVTDVLATSDPDWTAMTKKQFERLGEQLLLMLAGCEAQGFVSIPIAHRPYLARALLRATRGSDVLLR